MSGWRLCPKCRKAGSIVFNSRWSDEGTVRRRRKCTSEQCGHRFTTVEVLIPTGGHSSHFMDPVGNAIKIVIDDIAAYLTSRADRIARKR